MNILAALVPLLVTLLDKFFPGGAANAKAPSTAIGAAELAAALEVFHLSHDMAGALAAAAIALLGVVNVYRREHPAKPAPAPAPVSHTVGPQ